MIYYYSQKSVSDTIYHTYSLKLLLNTKLPPNMHREGSQSQTTQNLYPCEIKRALWIEHLEGSKHGKEGPQV